MPSRISKEVLPFICVPYCSKFRLLDNDGFGKSEGNLLVKAIHLSPIDARSIIQNSVCWTMVG